jgi:hypothetical protein
MCIHLTDKQRTTFEKICQPSFPSDITWSDVLDLLKGIREACGGEVKEYGNKVFIFIPQTSRTWGFQGRKGRNVSPSTIKDLQEFLESIEDTEDTIEP